MTDLTDLIEKHHAMIEKAIESWDLEVPDFAAKPPRPSGHVPACVYGCCWKLPGESWDEAKKKWREPPKGLPPMPPGNYKK